MNETSIISRLNSKKEINHVRIEVQNSCIHYYSFHCMDSQFHKRLIPVINGICDFTQTSLSRDVHYLYYTDHGSRTCLYSRKANLIISNQDIDVHELVHSITNEINPNPNSFLEEGIAMYISSYLEGTPKTDVQTPQDASEYMRKCTNDADYKMAFDLCSYLIALGRAFFFELYKAPEYVFEEVINSYRR